VRLFGFIIRYRKNLSPCLNKHHTTKAYVGFEACLHAFLTLVPTVRESSLWLLGRFTIREKASSFQFGRSLGGPQGQSGRFLEDINVFSLPGIKPLSPIIVQHMAYLLITVVGILTHHYFKSISFWISCDLRSFRFSYVCVLQIFTKQWK
jgi:hypothetical protein